MMLVRSCVWEISLIDRDDGDVVRSLSSTSPLTIHLFPPAFQLRPLASFRLRLSRHNDPDVGPVAVPSAISRVAMESTSHSDDASASLRSNWKFPAVVHFCRVFEGVLSLRQFSSDKFEAALLNPGDHSVFLSELISRLLYPGRKKNVAKPETTWPTWETNLLKKVKTYWSLTMDHDPLERQQHFVEVSSSEKVMNIH